LRWIAVLPAAILSGLILPLIFELIIWFADWWTDWFIDRYEKGFGLMFFAPLMKTGLSSYIFVYVGTITAPNYQRAVSIILGFLLAIFYSLIVYEFIKYELIWSAGTSLGWYFILWALASLAGIGFGILKTWDEY
jgi:hypothetical protein